MYGAAWLCMACYGLSLALTLSLAPGCLACGWEGGGGEEEGEGTDRGKQVETKAGAGEDSDRA